MAIQSFQPITEQGDLVFLALLKLFSACQTYQIDIFINETLAFKGPFLNSVPLF
jgi:hypothetical protein